MYQKGLLTIDGWPQGVADSATLGFASINNCEIFETPGTLKIAPATSNYLINDGITLTGLPIAYAEDPSGNKYFLTDDGKVYKSTGGAFVNIKTGLSGAQDMIFYRDYIWVSFGNSGGIVSLYGPTSSTSSWYDNVVTSLSSSYKKFIVCQDDKIYMSNGTNIKYMSGFTPVAAGLPPTVTFSTTGWSVPGVYTNSSGAVVSSQYITTMIEYGRNINLGTTAGNIYQWDRADTQLTDVPFKFSSGQINQLITKENVLYITAGNRGNVYRGDGTNFSKMQKIKWRQRRPYASTVSLRPNAITISPFGTLLIGSSTESDSYPSTSLHGIHEIQLQGQSSGITGQFTSYPTVFKQTISTGNTGTSQALYIGMVATVNGVTYIGWQDGSTYGLDQVGLAGSIYTSAVCESPLYDIATRLDQKTFTHLEFKLGVPLISGQSLSIQFRKSLTTDYDTARVYSFASLGAKSTYTVQSALTDVDQLQCKITLVSPAGVGDTNLELLNISLW